MQSCQCELILWVILLESIKPPSYPKVVHDVCLGGCEPWAQGMGTGTLQELGW